MRSLSKSAENVQRALAEKGLKLEVLELEASTRTANDAARTIGCQVRQIVKSLLFRTKETERPIVLLVSGKNRLNEEAIQRNIGEKIIKADANFTREITGFAIGGIPPLGHSNPISLVYIDEELLQYETLWAAAGTPFALFSLPAKDLQKVTGGMILSLKESS
jgi:prolyl-tRNA editing enzyme YbaK/EbsC (Cys-tRNA(Pro) deacylase)